MPLTNRFASLLPSGFSHDAVNASWAFYSTQKAAVLPIGFNRTGEASRRNTHALEADYCKHSTLRGIPTSPEMACKHCG